MRMGWLIIGIVPRWKPKTTSTFFCVSSSKAVCIIFSLSDSIHTTCSCSLRLPQRAERMAHSEVVSNFIQRNLQSKIYNLHCQLPASVWPLLIEYSSNTGSSLINLLAGPSCLTSSVISLTTSTNLVASAEEIQEKWRRPGSMPRCSIRFLKRANFLLA